MNIKNWFKKKKQKEQEQEANKKLLSKYRDNPQIQQMGLDMIRGMPKWQQKAILKTLPKSEREIAKSAIDGDLNVELPEDKSIKTVEEYEEEQKK